MSEQQPQPDPTVPPRPAVRQVSRGALVGLTGCLFVLFLGSILLGNRDTARAPAAPPPPAVPGNTEARIQNLLKSARQAEEDARQLALAERERTRALDEYALLEAQGGFPPEPSQPSREEQYLAGPEERGPSYSRDVYSSPEDYDAPRSPSEARTAEPRLSREESRLREAYESPIVAQAGPRAASRAAAHPGGSLALPPIPSLRELLESQEDLPQAAPPAAAPAPPAAVPAETASRLRSLPPTSPATLLAGSVIPATLTSKVVSDLPGTATAIVSQDVYDTLTGRLLLIPRGSRLFGRYNNQVAYGQQRLAIAWSRLTLPNGTAFELTDLASSDSAGAAGLTDQVDRHLGRLYGSALLLSVISAGAQLSQPDTYTDSGRSADAGSVGAAALGQRLNDVSTSLVERELQVRPTVVLRPGMGFTVMATTDIVFPSS